MSDGIKKIRESIKKRKRIRHLNEYNQNQSVSLLPTDEERHGFPKPLDMSTYKVQSNNKRSQTTSTRIRIQRNLVGAILLFGLSGFILKSDMPSLNMMKEWTTHQLNEDLPFAKMNEWYVATFGTPIAISPQSNSEEMEEVSLPFMGEVVETFAMNGTGIKMASPEKSVVSAFKNGIVIFVGHDRETKKTIIIQHADGSKSTYGYLSETDVYLYAPVRSNEKIGTFQQVNLEDSFFFSIEKNNEFIDPTQVISVDTDS